MEAAARAFDALITEFYDVWFRFHPVEALQAGVSGYEGGLPVVDDDDTGALAAWLEATIIGLEELDYDSLDDDRRIDLELLFCACRDEHQSLLESDWRHRDPVGFLPFHSIHQLVTAPRIAVPGAVERCLGGVPEFLRHARNQLSTFPQLIPPEWLQSAILEAEAGICYLQELAVSPQVSRHSPDPFKVSDLCDQAIESVTAFIEFLRQEIGQNASGVVACGEERFRRRLFLRHGLSCSPAPLRRLAEQVYSETLSQLSRLSLVESGKESPNLWLERLAQRKVMDREDALEFAREQSQELHRFLTEKNIFHIPEASSLKILPAPGCLRADRCPPAYLPPVSGDPTLTGLLYLPPDSMNADYRLPEQLLADCIRQGWPGLHLQAVTAAISPVAGSLVRRLNPSASMQRGWPLYVEQLLHDQGYGVGPEQSLVRLAGRLRQALLAILDLQIHLDGMHPGEAMQRLQSLPGVTPLRAELDLLELTRNPAEHLAGVVGCCLISELRQQLESEAAGFALRDFHRALLEQGAVAVPVLIRRVFGGEVLSSLLNRLELEGEHPA